MRDDDPDERAWERVRVNPIVSDLRHLKLAELYELAFERFVRDLALRTVRDPNVRAQIMRLVPDDDPHAGRIQAEIRRLNASVREEDMAQVERAALLDIVDVERSARQVYLDLVDKAHDPAIVKLFKELAHEEAEHTRIAERILTDHDLRHERVTSMPPTQR
jgi:rubrerythrin